jgi:hypothetical protein
MDEPHSLVGTFLAWLRETLPWAALGAAGGALALLAIDRQITFRVGVQSLLRSSLAGAIAGLILSARGYSLGDTMIVVVVAGLVADFAVLKIRKWIDLALDAAIARWVARRGGGGGPPPPPGSGTP